MTPTFRQDTQDDRTWVLEQLIKYEGGLDNRMYECATNCVSWNIINDVKDVIKTWEDHKTQYPSTIPTSNRL